MTVKELIAELSKCEDEESQVFVMAKQQDLLLSELSLVIVTAPELKRSVLLISKRAADKLVH